MSATPTSMHCNLSITDAELKVFKISFMSMPYNLNLEENEQAQAVLIVAIIQHKVSWHAASPIEFNP